MRTEADAQSFTAKSRKISSLNARPWPGRSGAVMVPFVTGTGSTQVRLRYQILLLSTVVYPVTVDRREYRGKNVVVSYARAAVRHFEDAEKLAEDDRLDGAGHLIGFAAECAIKYSVESLRPTNQAPHLHFPELIERAKKLLHGRRKHSVFTLIHGRAFMEGWNVNQRYSDNGAITPTRYQAWRSDATRALGAAGLRRKTQ
jgi:hypothetical protein